MKEVVLQLGAKVGRVLEVDESTVEICGKFVRLKVMLDITKPLRRGVMATVGGKKMWFVVKYERLPNFCYECGRVGHVETDCDHEEAKQYHNEYGDWLRASPMRAAPRGMGGRFELRRMGTEGGDDGEKDERIELAATKNGRGDRRSLLEELGEDNDEGGGDSNEIEKTEEQVLMVENLQRVGLEEKEPPNEKEMIGIEDGLSKNGKKEDKNQGMEVEAGSEGGHWCRRGKKGQYRLERNSGSGRLGVVL